MGSNKVSAQDRQSQGYSIGYSKYQPGINPIDLFGETQSNLNIGAYRGWADAAAAYEAQQASSYDMWGALEGMMAGMSENYAIMMASQQEAYAKAQEEAARNQGLNDTQTAYSSYLDAASTATDYINSQIKSEQSNAALLGIDYNITDADKASRINNYFSTLWGEGDQQNLEQLVTKWGEPTGFAGYTVTRGDGGSTNTQTSSASGTVATTSGIKPGGGISKSIMDEESETSNLLGA